MGLCSCSYKTVMAITYLLNTCLVPGAVPCALSTLSHLIYAASITISVLNMTIKGGLRALANVAQFVEAWSGKPKVLDSIPNQGTCLSFGFCFQSGHVWES